MKEPRNSRRALVLVVIACFFCTGAAETVREVSTAENCLKLNLQGCGGDEGRRNCRWSLGGERGCFLLGRSRLEHRGEASALAPLAQALVDIDREREEACGIRLTIQTMDLAEVDSKGFCMDEYVSIDYCVPEGGARFCGNKSHGTYEYPFENDALSFRLAARMASSSGAALISYVIMTDCRIQRRGLFWEPQYSTIPDIVPNTFHPPCYAEIRGSKGSFNSPWYPEEYPPNVDCVYRIFRNNSKICKVLMTTKIFETEGAAETTVGPACSDFLHAPGCGFVCGSLRFQWIAKYQPGASSFVLHFHTDGESETRGFEIEFQQQECQEY